MSLPWLDNISEEGEISDIFKFILKRRIRNFKGYSQLIQKSLPEPLAQAFTYIRSLQFEEKPNYGYIRSCFEALMLPEDIK